MSLGKAYRGVVEYQNLYTGEIRKEYTKPYQTKAGATRMTNEHRKKFLYERDQIFVRRSPTSPGFHGGYYVDDPNDTRADEELFPYKEHYVEQAEEWRRV